MRVAGAAPGSGRSRWFSLHRLALTAVLFVTFFWIYFQRMSLAVIAPQLETSFGLSAAALGLLGSAYFYPYALMQLPLGVLVDAVGTRRILTLFVGAAGLGSLLFALAGSFEQALAGRALVGLGAASVWLASQRLFVDWYRPRQFATINGLMNTVGNLGGLAGSLPLAVAAGLWGWRSIFVDVGLITLAMAILCLVIVRETPSREKAVKGMVAPPAMPILDSLRLVLSRRQLWLLAVAMLPFMGTRFGFQSLWGGPYLSDVQHLDESQIGSLLMAMSVAIAVAGPAVGYLSDHVFRSRRRMSVAGFSLYALCWMPLALAADRISLPLLYPLVIGLGVCNCFWITVFAQAKEMYPPALAGTALAVVNLTSALGGAVYQQTMGVVIGFFEKDGGAYPTAAYSAAFGFCLATMVVATLLVAVSREAPAKQ